MARRYLVVGNGPAGLTAAETVRSHDPAADITIVGDEPFPFYSRPGLAYLLTGTVPERQLFSRPPSGDADAGFHRIVGKVRAIDRATHQVLVADGQMLGYDRLLLAVGARAIRPTIPGIALEGVVTLDNLADARQILRLARRAKRACVVGGGITAVELAEGLAARGVETHYLMRGDRYWGSVLDPQESDLVERRLEADGIRIHRGVELSDVVGRGGRVVAIRTRSGDELPCQILAIAIGVQPRLELAGEAGLATGRGIWVDDAFHTSDPDIFAAGDVAELLDPATGKRAIDSLWSVAIDQGRAAGEHLCGTGRPWTRRAPFNVTRIGGVTTTLIGGVAGGGQERDLVAPGRGDSPAWRERLDAFAVVSEAGVDHLRLQLADDRIVGAVVMGDQALSRPLQHLVRERVDISDVRDRLTGDPAVAHAAILALAERMVAR